MECALSNLKLCPASTMPNFTASSDHLYPMEIYFSKRLSEMKLVDSIEKCNVAGKDREMNFTCPLHSVGCPLIEDNVQEGLRKSSNWKKSTSLCTLKAAIANSSAAVNVYVFGGSVTAGVDTAFCCSHAECEPNETKRCAWPHHFERWLQSISLSKVTTFNLGRPGTSSDQSGERLQEYLDKVGTTNFTQNDLILLDHSFNDFAMSSLPAKAKMERGLEKLIRRIITMSVEGIPTIVLMETDTRASQNTYYPQVYDNLAQHYGLRIYSYLDAMRTNHSLYHQKSYHHHLTHQHRRDDHPPWHTHLIYADFVSSLLLHEMSECDTTYKTDGVAVYKLPSAVTNTNDSAHCNAHYPPVLRVSYDDILSNTTIGKSY